MAQRGKEEPVPQLSALIKESQGKNSGCIHSLSCDSHPHPLDLWIAHWLLCSSSWPSSSRMLFTKCGVSAWKWTHNIPCQFRPLHSHVFIPPYQLPGLWAPHCSLGQSLRVFPLSPLEWKIGDRNLISAFGRFLCHSMEDKLERERSLVGECS